MQVPVPPTILSDGYFIPLKTQDLFVQGNIECEGQNAATELVSSTGLVSIDTTTPTVGQVLIATSANAATWQTPSSGGTPGGSDTQVQYNSSGSFAGNSNMVFDGTNLTVGGVIKSNSTSTISPVGFPTGGAITTAGGINVDKDVYIGGILYLNDENSFVAGPHSMGEVTLPSGTPNFVDVTNTTLSTFGRVFLTIQNPGVGELGNIYITNQGAGTFTINSDNVLDTSSIAWMVVNYVGICLYAESTVELRSGKIVSLKDLKYGDYVLSHDNTYSKVVSFSGWDLTSSGASIEITSEKDEKDEKDDSIIVSDTHLVYNYDLKKYVMASELNIGDYVLINSEPRQITLLTQSVHTGWISPLTESGKIQVNGFAVSCHTHDSHDLVRFIYLPLRLYLWFFPNKIGTQPTGNSNFSIYYRRGPIGKLLSFLFRPFF